MGNLPLLPARPHLCFCSSLAAPGDRLAAGNLRRSQQRGSGAGSTRTETPGGPFAHQAGGVKVGEEGRALKGTDT